MEREPHHLSFENAKYSNAIIYGRTDYQQLALLLMNIDSQKADIYEGLTGSFVRERADNLYLPALEDDGLIRKSEHGTWELVKDRGSNLEFGSAGEGTFAKCTSEIPVVAQEAMSDFNVTRKALDPRPIYSLRVGQSMLQCFQSASVSRTL
jgi:hypothetical protein